MSKAITGLSPNTTYHYRVAAQNSVGTNHGADMTFTTAALPPTVTTNAASSVTTSGATLNGTVNANNASTTVTFEYGLDTSYGTTVTADQSPVTGSTNTAVSKTISGLAPNMTYHYRAVGTNSGGTINGNDMTFTTGAVAPTVTTNAATGIGTNSATLNGTVNANNASTAVTFEYGLDTSYGTTVTADQSPVTGSTNTAVNKTISGLAPNMTYHYRAVGTNSGGTTNGADMTFTTSSAAPSATTNPALAITTTGATLNGTVNAQNDSTTVTFEYGTTTAYGSTVTADQSPVSGYSNTAVSKTISGLAPNVTYHYRVVGQNSTGITNGSDMTFTTGAIAPTVTTDAASGVGTNSATLNGTVNANNASTTVTFEYGLTNAYGSTVTAVQSPVTGSTNAAVSKAISGLAPNTTYHFRAVGQNSGGTTYGADMTFTTGKLAPTATTGSASAISGFSATLNGTVNAQNDSTTVNFEYGLTNAYGSTVTADQSPVSGNTNTSVSKAISGLTPNMTYHFRVVAVNSAGTTYGADKAFTTANKIVRATFRSLANQDGWTLESSENSGKGQVSYNGNNLLGGRFIIGLPNLTNQADLYAGDDAFNRQFRSILSFNTSSLPDNAVIVSVTIKIKKQGQVGTNPFATHKNLVLDIRKPYFGPAAALKPADFQAFANRSGAGVFSTKAVNNWFSSKLKSSAFTFVNLGGSTQFRLRFQLDDNNDNGSDYLRFFSGNATRASYRPVLIVEYYVP